VKHGKREEPAGHKVARAREARADTPDKTTTPRQRRDGHLEQLAQEAECRGRKGEEAMLHQGSGKRKRAQQRVSAQQVQVGGRECHTFGESI
jgi:hypothetical protein